MGRLVFLIASHKNPSQICRLIKTLKLSREEIFILVHHDHTQSYLDLSSLPDTDDIHVLEKHTPVTWGEFSVVESELRCFQWIFDNKIEFDWLILLSGQDYPIKPIGQLKEYLASTEYDGFLEYFPAQAPPSTAWRWGRNLGIERYYYQYFTVSPLLKPLFYKLYRPINWQPLLRVKSGRFGAKIAIRRSNHPFKKQFQCYAGSQWHTLSRRCVEYIDQFIQENPKFVDYYRHTLIPDESFFQTILLNNSTLKLCNDNLRHIAWRPPYPAVLTTDNLPELMQSSNYFARKFDVTVDNQILDQIDQYLTQGSVSDVSSPSSK